MTNARDIEQALAKVVETIGGTPREGQIEMATAVDKAMNDGEHLLVQAGTGTGRGAMIAGAHPKLGPHGPHPKPGPPHSEPGRGISWVALISEEMVASESS